ncbi:MAG: ATP-binding protein [Candidatus Bipolaricaulia bacterium]
MEGIDVIVGERLAQAYLLVGEGRTEAARRLVRRIICRNEAGCAKFERGVHPDVRWVTKGKRAIGIDQIRRLQEDALYAPSEAEHKVYIIAEAEALSLEAANSLLRILEDPPPYLIFILLARSLDLLPTIISRCRVVRLTPQTPAAIREELRLRGLREEEIDYLLTVTKGLPQLLAELPEGLRPLEERAEVRERLKDLGDRELVRLLAKAASPIEFHEVALELLQRIPRLNSHQILNMAAALARLPREAIKALFREAVFRFRDLLVIPSLGAASKGLPSQVGGGYDPLRLLELIPMLERTRRELEGNANLQLLLEVSLLRMREAAG